MADLGGKVETDGFPFGASCSYLGAVMDRTQSKIEEGSCWLFKHPWLPLLPGEVRIGQVGWGREGKSQSSHWISSAATSGSRVSRAVSGLLLGFWSVAGAEGG